MRLFQNECRYNAQSGKWEEIFWIDGIITDGDSYFYEQEREKELENNKLLKAIEIEDECEEENCCDCYECTIDRYVELLCEITGGCPNCIRSALECFCDDIVEHIVVEDEDIDENEKDNKPSYQVINLDKLIFPNVTDSDELRKAIMDLPRLSLQYSQS